MKNIPAINYTESMRFGFTLVELAIVLVILGLLAGGVITGQSLIRAAELKSVITEFQEYRTAINSFRDRYRALPGDMTNATSFWGAPSGSVANCPGTIGTGTETCDGNGNGKIQHLTPGGISQYAESFMAWQHLANAGLIDGQYSGLTGPSGNVHQVADENVPRAKPGNAVWYVGGSSYSGHGYYSDGLYENVISIGGPQAGNITMSSAFSPEEAWNIDSKIDDGLPQHGTVWAVRWDHCTDAATSAATNGAYLLLVKTQECALAFRGTF